jgi:phage protein D
MAEEKAATGAYLVRHRHPNKREAKARAKSKQASLERATRTLHITIIGDPAISAEMTIVVSGLRDRIDDEWRVKTATHSITSAGYRTTIEAEKPGAAKSK